MELSSRLVNQHSFLCHLPFLVVILAFLTLHLGLTLKRATASYLYEGLVTAAIEPYAADRDRVSAITWGPAV